MPDFHTAEYWDTRFRSERGTEGLDWYPEAVPLLVERLRLAGITEDDRLAVLGCGTSGFGTHIWKTFGCSVDSCEPRTRGCPVRGYLRLTHSRVHAIPQLTSPSAPST